MRLFGLDSRIGRHLSVVVLLAALCGPLVQIQAQEVPTHHDDDRVSVAFDVEEFSVLEYESYAFDVKLVADQPVTDRLVVRLNLSGTATRNVDYEIASTLVTFEEGEEVALVRFEPLRDWIWEGDETIQLEIDSFLGNGQVGSPSVAEITVLDDEFKPVEGEPNYRELRKLSDIYTFSYMRIEEDRIWVAVIVRNHGALPSEQTRVTLTLADDAAGENVVHSASRIVPELSGREAANRSDSFWGEWIVIHTNGLRPSTIYYGEIILETYEGEAYTFNNDDSFGFVLDAQKHVQSQCDHEATGLVTGTDPFLSEQWYIQNNGQRAFSRSRARFGEDLHMHDTIAEGVVGQDVKVAIVDTGLEICHPDLVENIEADKSYNFLTVASNTDYVYGSVVSDPFNPNIYGDHGTSVGGLVGATANNGIGIRGIAPNVRLRGFNYLLFGTDASEFASLGGSSSEPVSTDVDIFNMSYGSTSWREPNEDTYRLFEVGTSELRDEKGAIYVKSAGNGWRGCDTIFHPIHREIGCTSTASDYKHRIPYLLTVGALDADGRPAPYSSSGSNIWISAPAGWWGRNQPALLTTDQIGEERGYHLYGSYGLRPENQHSGGDYISTFNGTSGAAGIVSGVVALLLEEQPDLTWRDVKHVLASTARESYVDTRRIRVVLGDEAYTLLNAWQLNDAGYAYHNRYGFGAVDVDRAMEFLATYKPNSLGEFRKTEWLTMELSDKLEIPDGDGTGTTIEMAVESPRSAEMSLEAELEAFAASNIEMVQVQIELEHEDVSHLGVTLISPSGMESIVNPVFNDALPRDPSEVKTFLFASNAFYGESPVGNWKIKIVDAMAGETGTLNDIQLRIYYGSHP